MGRARTVREEHTYPALLARPIRSILVVKLRAIGDVLLSTAVIPNLRAAFPDARIHFLTESAAADIIRGNQELDESIVFHPRKDSYLTILRRLYAARYDLVFDLFCNPRSAQMTFATRAPLRVGYPFRGRAWAYNVHLRSRADRVHNTQFNLDALRALAIPVHHERPVFPLPAAIRTSMHDMLASQRKGSGPLIALNPSGTWDTKRWGLEHFAALGDRLAETIDAEIVLLWGPGEEADVRSISALMKSRAIIPPPTTICELGGIAAACDFVISNDAGPMHIAAAVGTRTLGIFGPTNPALQGPYNDQSGWIRLETLDCLACNLTACDIGNVCMTNLSVDMVYQAFLKLKRNTEG